MAKSKLDPIRKQQRARVKEIAQQSPFDDIFHGMGDFVPRDTSLNAIARVIAKLEGIKVTKPKLKIAKEKTVKRAPKPKVPPKPKKGVKVGKVNIVTVKSPNGHEQPIPLVADLKELLLDGWQIVGDETTVNKAYAFLDFNPEEQRA